MGSLAAVSILRERAPATPAASPPSAATHPVSPRPYPAPAALVAAAPRRGNPLARRGTWQRLLALGDGRVGGVREHAIHAVAEHRRVQVGIGVGQGINMHEQPRRAQPLQAIRISLGGLGANAISARGNRRDIFSLTGAAMLQPTPSGDATPLVRLKVARPRRRCVGSRHYPLSAIGRPVVIEPSVVLELKCRDTNLAV